MARVAPVVREDAEEFARVRPERTAAQIERAEAQKRAAERHAHDAVEGRFEIHLRGGGSLVRKHTAEDKPWQGGGKRLPVPAVAPVRHEKPARAVEPSRPFGGNHVLAHVLDTAGERVPRARAGTDVEVEPGGAELRGLRHERMVALVAPVEGDEILRQFGDELGMLQNHVPPEHRPLPVLPREGGDLFEEVEVDTAFAPFPHGGGAAL